MSAFKFIFGRFDDYVLNELFNFFFVEAKFTFFIFLILQKKICKQINKKEYWI